MRFYDINFMSLVFIGLIYFVGTSFLVRLGRRFRKQFTYAWPMMVPLFLLLYAAPVAEEAWIAWHFGQLCKKDAGIFVKKTVKVDGFYDASAVLPIRYKNFAYESVDYYKMGGYRYFEFGLAQPAGRPKKIVHIENVDGVWTPTVLDQPVSRYYYRQPHRGTVMSHKVSKVERVVTDSKTDESLARETRYRRHAPWFYVGSDRPVVQCPEPGEHPLSKFGSVYKLSLIPTAAGT